jgi:putative ABC transport system permease protein
MLKIALKGMWAHKRRLVGTMLAIVLGVAFLTGTTVLGDTLKGGFGSAFEDANAGIDAIVRDSTEADGGEGEETQRGFITEAAAEVDRLEQVPGVSAAAARIEGAAQIVSAEGDPIGGNGPPTFGAAWIDDERLESYELEEGSAPAAEGEVVIDVKSSEDGDIAVGDTFQVLTPEPLEVTLVGTVTIAGQDSLGGTSFVGFTPEQAAALFTAGPDQASSIVLAADEGVSQDELADTIAGELPDGQEVLTGEELTAEQRSDIESDFLGFFTTLLQVFAFIAMFVAFFSITNTFAIITAQRSRESALLRALGASRRQILLSTTLEAVLLGIVASTIGLVVGVGLASLATAGVGALGFPDSSLVVTGGALVFGFVVGLVVAVLASILPAVRASRIPPIAALREVSTDDLKAPVVRVVIGTVLLLAGLAGIGFGVADAGADGAASLVGLGAVLTLVAVIVLGPVVALPAARAIGLPLPALKGTTGRLARENASRNPKRTAASATALLIGVTIVVLFTILGASINASIQESINQSFAGDLVIAPQSFSGAGMDPQLALDIDALDEAEALGLGGALVTVDKADGTGTEELFPEVTDLSRYDDFLDLETVDGSLADVGQGDVALEDAEAEDRGLSVGDTLPVTYIDGTTEDLTVRAIYEENDLTGPAAVTPETWNPHAPQPANYLVMISAAEGFSVDEVRTAVEPLVEQYAAPDPLDRDEYLDLVAGQIQQALTILYALLALAIVIALMGIANTLSLSVHERTRELGLLRAVGQTRRQLRSMVRWESVIIALFGTLGGLFLGSVLGWAVYRTLAEAESGGAGAPTPFVLPLFQLFVIAVIGALVGVLAAARPARRAAKMDVLDAISQ